MKITYFHGYIVTSNPDGSIPFDSICIAEVPPKEQEKAIKAVGSAPDFDSPNEAIKWLRYEMYGDETDKQEEAETGLAELCASTLRKNRK